MLPRRYGNQECALWSVVGHFYVCLFLDVTLSLYIVSLSHTVKTYAQISRLRGFGAAAKLCLVSPAAEKVKGSNSHQGKPQVNFPGLTRITPTSPCCKPLFTINDNKCLVVGEMEVIG